MQVNALFIVLAEPRDYDFQDQRTGKQIVGTSYKVACWKGNGDLPFEVKLAGREVYNNVRALGLKPLEPVVITYEVDVSNGRARVGKCIAIDRAKDVKAA
jgi:hypothetical protein